MRVRLGGRVIDNDTASLYRRFGYSDVCCPEDVRKAIEEAPEGEPLVFEINSGGGSVYAGFEMYSLIRDAGRETVAEIGSIAASAATVIASGCSKVRISPVANWMVHRASISTSGNSEDHEQSKQMLDTIDESVLNAYDEKTGEKCSRDKIRELMEKETFLTAEQAVELGFADELMFQGGEAMAQAAAAMAGGMPQVLASLPPIEELKRRESGVENTTGTPENEKEERNMPITLDELRNENPELLNEIRAEAAKAERDRMNAIDGVALAGFEDLIAAAKADPEATAGSVAAQIVKRQKAQGDEYLKNRNADAEDSGAGKVESEAPTGADDDRELNAVLDEVFGKK